MKLTETQSKALQIILGILGGAALWFAIALPTILKIPSQDLQNSIWGYLFLIVFVVILVIQRTIEKRIGHRLRLFFRAYLISLIVGLGVFILYALQSGIAFINS